MVFWQRNLFSRCCLQLFRPHPYKNDIFRLVQLLDPEERIDISDSVKEDLKQFFALIENEKIDMKALHLNYAKEDAIRIIKQVFQMD